MDIGRNRSCFRHLGSYLLKDLMIHRLAGNRQLAHNFQAHKYLAHLDR